MGKTVMSELQLIPPLIKDLGEFDVRRVLRRVAVGLLSGTLCSMLLRAEPIMAGTLAPTEHLDNPTLRGGRRWSLTGQASLQVLDGAVGRRYE